MQASTVRDARANLAERFILSAVQAVEHRDEDGAHRVYREDGQDAFHPLAYRRKRRVKGYRVECFADSAVRSH